MSREDFVGEDIYCMSCGHESHCMITEGVWWSNVPCRTNIGTGGMGIDYGKCDCDSCHCKRCNGENKGD